MRQDQINLMNYNMRRQMLRPQNMSREIDINLTQQAQLDDDDSYYSDDPKQYYHHNSSGELFNSQGGHKKKSTYNDSLKPEQLVGNFEKNWQAEVQQVSYLFP